MNDDELMTAVRDSFAGVHSATPVEQIVRRSRAVRARRRIPVLAGALAVAAGAAIAVTALLPGQHSGPVTVQLAAWTVTRQADGSVSVTLRELRDPAGLQRTLRADGVPASVTFFGQQNPACRPYPYHRGQPRSEAQRQTAIQPVLPGVQSTSAAIVRSGPPQGNVLLIDPSLLPRGVGLQIGAGPVADRLFRIWAGLVQASQQCTGS